MKKSLKMFLIVIALVICIGGYITIVYTYKTNDKEVEQAMQGHPYQMMVLMKFQLQLEEKY